MKYVELTLPTPEENLALDEALLLQAEAGEGGEMLRVWEWPTPAVVLGAACSLAVDVDEAACRADSVPILRRASGGGTVLLGRGCLCFSLVLAYDRDPRLREIPSSYAYILEQVSSAIADLVPNAERQGTSDLAVSGSKFSGNAQQRKRRHLLHHGTLLYHFDLASVHRYLRMPTRQPEYRAGRAHDEFLMNLPMSRDELTSRLRETWRADVDRTDWPATMVSQLVEEKYRKVEWIRRR